MASTRKFKAIERDGMVARTVHGTVPPSVERAPTPLGQSLAVPIMALADWTFAHLPQIRANRAVYELGGGGGGLMMALRAFPHISSI